MSVIPQHIIKRTREACFVFGASLSGHALQRVKALRGRRRFGLVVCDLLQDSSAETVLVLFGKLLRPRECSLEQFRHHGLCLIGFAPPHRFLSRSLPEY